MTGKKEEVSPSEKAFNDISYILLEKYDLTLYDQRSILREILDLIQEEMTSRSVREELERQSSIITEESDRNKQNLRAILGDKDNTDDEKG